MSTLSSLLIFQAVAILLPLIAAGIFPKLMRLLWADLRIPRILHYALLGAFGMALWLRHPAHLASSNLTEVLLRWSLLASCLSYAAIFAIITNNIEDLEADRITNPGRPLVLGLIDTKSYLLAGIVAEIIALGLAFAANSQLGLGILAISLGYFVYSCRPTRLKRVPILSKMIIGFNSFCVALAGFVWAGGEWQHFPWIWAVFILAPLSLAANFIDLKDTEGDRLQGIATLPVLLGESLARHLIALATLATYVMGAILLNIAWLYPLNLLGAGLHIYFLYRKPYQEGWIFLILMAALSGLVGFLFLSEAVF
jgi:4-hydroxybenzoate polyprenyltransferase